MIKNYTLVLSTLLTIFSTALAFGQHTTENHDEHSTSSDSHGTIEHHSEHGKNKIAVYVGFTHVSAAYYEHETHQESVGKWIPTLGAEYYRTVSPMFDIGFVGDIELDQYIVHTSNENELSRANVVVMAGVVRYKPIPRLGLFAGPGFETEFKSNEEGCEFLWVGKFGIDYEVEISNGWELTPTFSYDLKQHYSACAFGMSLGKRF